MLQLAEVIQMVDKFDIVHFHTDILHYNAWRHIDVPQVTTMHGRMNIPDLQAVYQEFNDMSLVSISNSQRKPLPNVNWSGTVYNGIPADDFTLHPTSGDYFAFLGRMSPG